MGYTAWSDGSYMEDGKTYIAYIITNNKNIEIQKTKAEVTGLNTSYEAEFAAMYYLFKKIIELELEEIEINTDCLTLYTNLRKKRKKVIRYEEDLVKRLEEKFGKRKVSKLIGNIHWKRRDQNQAHPLFAEKLTEEVKDFNREFGKLIRTSKRYRQQNPREYVLRQREFLKKRAMEKMFWSGILHLRLESGEYKLPVTVLSKACKMLNTKTQKETIKKLEKKMAKATIEKDGRKKTVYRKGRLEIDVLEQKIVDIRVMKRNYVDRYKENGKRIYRTFDVEKVLKKARKDDELLELENQKYKINKRAYNAIAKRVGEKNVGEFIKKTEENGMYVGEGDVYILVKGEVHLLIEKEAIIDITITLSNLSKRWMKSQKSA